MTEEIKPNSKIIKIFPYKYDIEGIGNEPKLWEDKFSKDNVEDNTIEYSRDAFLLLVVDDVSNDFIFGRFLKLRNDVPLVINRKDGEERKIDILDDENIIEQSHFIINVKDNFLFAEYNFNGIRHFVKPFAYYLNKLFDVKNNDIKPLTDTNTFTKLQGEEEINSFRLSVAQENIGFLEEKFNLNLFQSLIDVAKDNETSFEIIIKKSRRKKSTLDKEKILKISKELTDNKAPLQRLNIESEDVSYDLINNNLINYKVYVKLEGRGLNSNDFYFSVRNLYERQIEKIKQSIKTD